MHNSFRVRNTNLVGMFKVFSRHQYLRVIILVFILPGSVAYSGSGSESSILPGVLFILQDSVVKTVTIIDPPAPANRIGQRLQFNANATDFNDTVIRDVDVNWESTDSQIASIDSNGMVTTRKRGVTTILVTAQNKTDSFELAVSPADTSDVGEIYTVWPAWSDKSPAWLVNERLTITSNFYDPARARPGNGATTPWAFPGVERFQWHVHRLGILSDMHNGLGTFRVTDRNEEWTALSIGNAANFQLEGNRIALTTGNGLFRVKDGIHGPWTNLETSGVMQYQLEGNRIAVLRNDGIFRVKDGIHGAWTVLASTGVSNFQLEGNRIGVLYDDGKFRVKDGIHGAWTVLASAGVSKFQLAGNRIGELLESGVFRVKDGIHGTWTTLASAAVKDFQLEGNHIGLHRTSGAFWMKAGINGGWVILANGGVKKVQLQGSYIGLLVESNDREKLRFKLGINGGWTETPEYAAGEVTQFYPYVSVKMAPFRTTPASYATGQAACHANQPVDCQTPILDKFPADHWGRFCGKGVPGPENQDAARSAGPIDGLDNLCRHHDGVQSWYSESRNGDFDACIVQYGLVNAKLTNDGGRRLEEGSSAWNAVWARMPALKKAVDDYKEDTDSPWCNEEALAVFTTDTR